MSLSAFVLLSIVLFYTVNVASLGSANIQRETLCIRKIVTFLTWQCSFVRRVLSTKTRARNYERPPRLPKPNSKTKSHEYHQLHILHDQRLQCSIIITLHKQFSLQMNRYVSQSLITKQGSSLASPRACSCLCYRFIMNQFNDLLPVGLLA